MTSNIFSTLILLLIMGTASSLTCNEVLLSDVNKIKLYELQSLSPQDVLDCLSHLAKNKITSSEATFIWKSIINFYSGIPNIPEDTLAMLHWVTIAIQPEDYENMTLGTLEVITNFGYDYGLSNKQLLAIADRVRSDFGAKQPEDFTSYDLIALRQILCTLNKSEVEGIHPKAYKEASLVIGMLKNCNFDVLQGFANLAIQKDAFGSPDTWTQHTVQTLGVVAAHLPEVIAKKLKKKLGNYILKGLPKKLLVDCFSQRNDVALCLIYYLRYWNRVTMCNDTKHCPWKKPTRYDNFVIVLNKVAMDELLVTPIFIILYGVNWI